MSRRAGPSGPNDVYAVGGTSGRCVLAHASTRAQAASYFITRSRTSHELVDVPSCARAGRSVDGVGACIGPRLSA